MNCPDKLVFQQQLTAALNAFYSKVKDLDLPLDPLTGSLLFRSPKERMERTIPYERKTGLEKPYLDLMALHRVYRQASRELSKHLSTHRC